jgi:hypothetical protein
MSKGANMGVVFSLSAIALFTIIGVILNKNQRQYMSGPQGKNWITIKEDTTEKKE